MAAELSVLVVLDREIGKVQNLHADFGCSVDVGVRHLYQDADGEQATVDFTGCTSRLRARSQSGDDAELFDVEVGSGITVEDDGTLLRLLITPAMWPSEANKTTSYDYDWIVTLDAGVLGGATYKLMGGTFEVSATVSA